MRSAPLLAAAASVPRATLTPASSSSWTGVTPLPIFAGPVGQCTTLVPVPLRRSDLVGVERAAVDEDDVLADHLQPLQELDLAAAVLLGDVALLAVGHRVVLAEPHAFPSGERDELAEESLGAAARRARAEPDPDVLRSVEALGDRERILDGLVRRLVETGVERRLVEVPASVGDRPREDRPHAARRDHVDQRCELVPTEDQRLEERGRAGLDHLDERQPRRRLDVRGGVVALEDEDPLRHPDPERHLVGAPAQHRLREVHVAVDEARQHEPAVQVADVVSPGCAARTTSDLPTAAIDPSAIARAAFVRIRRSGSIVITVQLSKTTAMTAEAWRSAWTRFGRTRWRHSLRRRERKPPSPPRSMESGSGAPRSSAVRERPIGRGRSRTA